MSFLVVGFFCSGVSASIDTSGVPHCVQRDLSSLSSLVKRSRLLYTHSCRWCMFWSGLQSFSPFQRADPRLHVLWSHWLIIQGTARTTLHTSSNPASPFEHSGIRGGPTRRHNVCAHVGMVTNWNVYTLRNTVI